MEIIFSEDFKEDYKKINDQSIRLKIVKVLKKLETIPTAGKPLRYGLRGHRRLRIDPFRIIYKIENERIIIICFEHRKSVYR